VDNNDIVMLFSPCGNGYFVVVWLARDSCNFSRPFDGHVTLINHRINVT